MDYYELLISIHYSSKLSTLLLLKHKMLQAVSYTHLDVYKRQELFNTSSFRSHSLMFGTGLLSSSYTKLAETFALENKFQDLVFLITQYMSQISSLPGFKGCYLLSQIQFLCCYSQYLATCWTKRDFQLTYWIGLVF